MLSFYFEPDLSAGSFRSTALVRQLAEVATQETRIEVLTTRPNRYSTYLADAPARELRPGVEIHRFALPSHRSGMIDQSKSFAAFALQALRHVRAREYDLVYATSSRLMTAALGAFIAWRKRAPLYLDIRDIFLDTMTDLLPGYAALIARPMLGLLERWTMNRATKINLVSPGFEQYFSSRYPEKDYSFFTNGIDDEFTTAAAASQPLAGRPPPGGLTTVLYAGNLGEGQGLHHVVPNLAASMRSRIHFKIIGDGGRRAALQHALAAAGVENVELLPPMNRGDLIAAYRAADVLFVHLNDFQAFSKVLPSKLFEYAAMGKPIWAGVGGYAAEFIRAQIDNAVVFRPCNAVEGEEAFGRLVLRDTPRPAFIQQYMLRRIMLAMTRDILSLVRRGTGLRSETREA